MTGMNWRVRRATATDVPGLAMVNIASWRQAYQGIVPDHFLDRMDVARREAVWARWVALPPPNAVFVATGEAGEVVAYCGVAEARDEEDRHPELPTAALLAIYADPAVWGKAAGHLVHEAGIAALADAGFKHAVLWVFEDNPIGRRFYERHGWTCDEVRKAFDIGGASPMEIRYSRPLP